MNTRKKVNYAIKRYKVNENFITDEYKVFHAFEEFAGTVYEDDQYAINILADRMKQLDKSKILEPIDLIEYFYDLEFATGPLSENDVELFAEILYPYFFDEVNEDMGGVSAPMSTPMNTPGVGNAQPASTAATTAAQQTSDTAIGSGDKWSDEEPTKKKKKKIVVQEGNLNPYDKIGSMIAKKMGVKQPFKKKDSKTNTVKQNIIDETNNPSVPFKIETLDSYQKASTHVPDHPLTEKKKKIKKVNEEDIKDRESLKNVKSKNKLTELGIPFIYKPGPSGKKRVYLKMDVNEVVKKLEKLEWTNVGSNTEKTIKKFHDKDGEMELAIFADGKDLPRVTLKPVMENLIPSNLEFYLK